MGKTRDFFKKIRDTKGTFHAKMGLIKDRNGMDLTEAEDIKKRWQEHTEELYKKDLHDPDNHDGVITHLEPDILECEVKWALESITMNKASRGVGIPVELFQILKNEAVKVLHSICKQIWKTQQWPQDWKRSVFIPIPKKGNAKECSNNSTIALISHASKEILKIASFHPSLKVLHSVYQQIWKTQKWPQDWKKSVFILIPKKGNAKEYSNYHTIAPISHASKVMLKILQPRLQQYVNHELPDVQALDLEKAEEPEIKLPTSDGLLEKQESSR